MDQKQRNFEIALKKGEIGEEIIREYLEGRGWVVYFPFTKNKAHVFDMLATKGKRDVMAADVKTKARLNKWAAQGINVKSYNEYLYFSVTNDVPFFLFFVCDKTGDVHCGDLRKLIKCESITPRPGIIAWYLSDMMTLFNIGSDNILRLSQLDQRNHDFCPTVHSGNEMPLFDDTETF